MRVSLVSCNGFHSIRICFKDTVDFSFVSDASCYRHREWRCYTDASRLDGKIRIVVWFLALHTLSLSFSGKRMWISHFMYKHCAVQRPHMQPKTINLRPFESAEIQWNWCGMVLYASFCQKSNQQPFTTNRTRLFWHNFRPVCIEAALHSNPNALLMMLVTIYSLCHYTSTTIFDFHSTPITV